VTTTPSDRSAGAAVAGLFFVNGAVFSNWVPRIPDVRDRLGVDNAGLGAALIGGGLGGIIGSLLVARVMHRVGSRRLVLVAAPLLAMGLPLLAVVPSPLALAVLLTSLGLLDVLNDLAMNAQGSMVQGRVGRSIMQRLHGTWSLGSLAGAAVGSLAAAAGIGVGVHLAAVAVALLAALFALRRSLIPIDEPTASETADPEGSRRSAPVRTVVVAMAVMAVGVAWLEATPMDWSSVALRDVFSMSRGSGIATVVFTGSMLLARLVGDAVLDRVGQQRLLDGALGLCGIGTLVIVTAPAVGIALAGFALSGLGAAVMFPQLYAMAATMPGSTAGAGLGAMAIGQRLGFLAAPLGVGAIAEAASLRWSFAVAGVAGLALVLGSRRLVGH
jgi:MFS family permease